ncbi:hypothetical protein JCM3765_001419 [Sporobolomyces pararoseus]
MSEPLEPVQERPTKRPRTKSPPPVASTSTLPQPEENAVVASNNNNPDSTPQDQEVEATAGDTEPRELTQAELDEKWRIYEMISEEYHDIVTELPLDYQRTFMLMKELDDEQQAHTSTLKTTLTNYFQNLPSYSTYAARASQFDQIQKDYLSTTRACEDKINLALTLYESVDRHIQRLDTDLAVYEDSLLIGLRKGTLPSNDAPSKLHNTQNQQQGGGAAGGSATGNGKSGNIAAEGEDEFVQREHEKEWSKIQGFVRKEQQAKKQKGKRGKFENQSIGGDDAGIIGMPVDPNEPRYCYCNGVSHGEMMGCDNEDCPIEWFHLVCTGLAKPPAGEWYCDECSKDRPPPDSDIVSSSPAKETTGNATEENGKQRKKKERKERVRKSDGKPSKPRKRKSEATNSSQEGGIAEGGQGEGEVGDKKGKKKQKEKDVPKSSSSASKEKSSTKEKLSSFDNKEQPSSSSASTSQGDGTQKDKPPKKKMGRPPKDKAAKKEEEKGVSASSKS